MNDRTKKVINAGSIDTDPEKLKRLSRDKDKLIRRRVAANQACMQSILTRLAKDDSKDVRREVALNPQSSYVTLTNLSFDRSPDVRYAIAESVRTPMALLRRMSHEDPNPYVRFRAQETVDNLEAFLEEIRKDRNIRCYMDHLE